MNIKKEIFLNFPLGKEKILIWISALLFAPLLVNGISLEKLLLTATSPLNLTTDNLNCSYNLAGNATTAVTAWYKNNTPLMVLYMPMEGNQQNALLDYSGNAHNGINVNATWNPNTGYDGNGAFDFNGDDYIDAGNIIPNTSYTKSAWVRFSPGALSNNIISGNNAGHAFSIVNDSGYRLEAGHNSVFNKVFDPNLFPQNVWTFVALTYDSSVNNGTLILYKNGIEVDKEINVPPILNDPRVLIGTYSAVCCWFNGAIDDTRIYDHALSPQQILSLYNNGGNIIANTETEVGDEWQCRVTPFSSIEAGATYTSNTLTIKPSLPSNCRISDLLLTATSPLNLTTDNLNCSYNLAGNATTAVTAWYKNNTPLMVLYMPMEGNQQNALLDYSGNAHNGINVNATWNPNTGYDGDGAFDFNGDDYIDAGNIMPNASYTKSAWVRFSPGALSNNIISGNNAGHAFSIVNDSGYRLEAGHNSVFNKVFDPNLFPQNVWTFVTLAYDSLVNNGTLILYKNGIEVDKEINVPPILNDPRVLIGTYSAVCCWFNGAIDDTRIYDHALSPQQILSLYNNGGNIIVNTETEVGDEWQCRVTPFSSIEAGATYTSNNLIIMGGLNIELKQGWNLISIPLTPLNNTVNAVFGSINYSGLFNFNNGWKVPEEIDNKLGYWIKVNKSINLTILGTEIENKTINLNKGWNLIGYPYLEEKSISSLFNNVTVLSYNKSKWYSYDSNKLPQLNTLNKFTPGFGYWVKREN